MRNVLRDLAWCVQDVLEAFYPLEREPSMADLQAQDEITHGPEWEPTFDFPEPDPFIEAVELLRDIRNILQSSFAPVEQPGAANERPESAGPTPVADSGHPNLAPIQLREASIAINAWLEGAAPIDQDRTYWRNLSDYYSELGTVDK